MALPEPVVGPYHSASLLDQVRLIRALLGTTDPTGIAEKATAIAYVTAAVDAIRDATRSAETKLNGSAFQEQLAALDEAQALISGTKWKNKTP